MLTIFGNLRISNRTRLQHLKDSYRSFNRVSDNWVINARSTYRKATINFLKNNLKNKLTAFELLNDERGWMNNALEMLEAAKYDYILNWNEDHLNIAPQSLYKNMLIEMEKEKVDYMMYSWWHFGNIRQHFNKLNLKKLKHIDTINLTTTKWERLKKMGHTYYLISSAGIFRKSLFKHFLETDRNKLPVQFSYPIFGALRAANKVGIKLDEQVIFPKINKIFGYYFPRYAKVTPHELEKDPFRTDVLPLKIALPKRELFACIDDDNGVEGYQLIKRGLYP